MNPSTIKCPECHAQITLGETFAAEHIEAERSRHRQAITELKSAYEQKEAAIAEREKTVRIEQGRLQEKLAAEREQLAKSIEQNIRQEMQLRLSNAEKQLSEKDQRLRQAESQELASRKRVAEADEKLQQAALEVQRRLDAERKALLESIAEREAQLEKVLAQREAAVAASEKAMSEKLAQEREKLAEQIQLEVRNDMQSRLHDADRRLQEKNERLKESERLELESHKRLAEADEKLRQSELEVQRKLAEERSTIREQALKESSEETLRKMAEKDQIIEQMNRRIEKLHRQADSKSQQLQGELEENTIYNCLCEHFPNDEIERIPRGRNGADIVFRVRSHSGKVVGKVLIEVKDTQHFSRSWIPKLKTDAHGQNADLAVIVSRALPEGIESFAQHDDIWVCRADVLIPLMTALRSEVTNVARERSKTALSDSTRDVVFQYLISAEFTRRVTMMVESYDGMRQSLDKQKRQFQQRMTEQERALDKMIAGVAGVYSDLNIRAGSALKPVHGLEMDDAFDSPQSTIALTENDAITEACVS